MTAISRIGAVLYYYALIFGFAVALWWLCHYVLPADKEHQRAAEAKLADATLRQAALVSDIQGAYTLTPAAPTSEPVVGMPQRYRTATLGNLRVVHVVLCDKCDTMLVCSDLHGLVDLFNYRGWRVTEEGSVLCPDCLARSIVHR